MLTMNLFGAHIATRMRAGEGVGMRRVLKSALELTITPMNGAMLADVAEDAHELELAYGITVFIDFNDRRYRTRLECFQTGPYEPGKFDCVMCGRIMRDVAYVTTGQDGRYAHRDCYYPLKGSAVSAPPSDSEQPLGVETSSPATDQQESGTKPSTRQSQDRSNKKG